MISVAEPVVLSQHKDLENLITTLVQIDSNDQLFFSVIVPLGRKRDLISAGQKMLELQRARGREYREQALEAIALLEKNFTEHLSLEASSLACFIRCGDEPVFESIVLPKVMDLNVNMGSLPMLFHLVEFKDVYHRFAVVVLTQTSAKIIQVNAGKITEQLMAGRLDLRSKIGREMSKDQYHNTQRERGVKFFKEKVSVLRSIVQENSMGHIILCGDPRLTSTFKDLLPHDLRSKVIDQSVDANLRSIQEILKHSLDVFVENESEESKRTVLRWRTELGKGGLVTSGVHAIEEALVQCRLDMLIISKSCPTSISEPLLRLAIQQNIEIETVDDEDINDIEDGVAGFLRYRVY
jgi:hypothetical protein